MVDSKKNSNCKFIDNTLFFDNQNKVKFCPYFNECEAVENLDGLWLDIGAIEKKRIELKNNPPDKCKNCSLKQIASNHKSKLYLANWHYCYVNCSYCKYPKQEDLIQAKHYDAYPYIIQLMEKQFLTKKTKIIFECGDACVHPEFDKIMYYFLNNEFKDIEINTPAQRFCESIAEGIARNTTKLIVSFDSGCQYIYHRIKRINKYDIAINNIKRYLQYQMPSKKNVILKYTIVQGINDNKKEPLDMFILARDMGINKLIFDIEKDFYEKSLNCVPTHIKEMMIFIKSMAKYNAFDIEFARRLNVLYEKLFTRNIR